LTLQDQLKKLKLHKLQPGQVYLLSDDSKLFMNDKSHRNKRRPVLIVSEQKYAGLSDHHGIHIIPLSTSASEDKYQRKINLNISPEIAAEKSLEKKAVAILHLYQPIDRQYLDQLVSQLHPDIYDMILNELAINNLGIQAMFDLDPD
jgi:hypothetical protein